MKIYIDEAGRWPLAWPLYVWLTIPIKRFHKKKFKDSKKLTEKQREILFSDIQNLYQKWSIIYATWIVDNQEIDNLWLTKAIRLAIKRWLFDIFKKIYKQYLENSLSRWLCSCDILNKYTIENILLKSEKDFINEDLLTLINTISQTNPLWEVVIDWNHDFWIQKELNLKTKTIVKWDDKIAEISISSIIAKVSRDNYIKEIIDEEYPAYNFKKHKWYWTLEHRNLIKKHWPCEIHRKSFLIKIK